MNGWIVTNGTGLRYRCWENGMPAWTADREKATRYARRADAEAAHQEDDEAWHIVEYVPPSTFEDFLKSALDRGAIDFSLRVVRGPSGQTDFYLHPTGQDGDTGDYTVNGSFVAEIEGGHGAGSRP